MKRELQCQVQAYLDGELPEREARRVGDWIAGHAEAQALLAELRMTRTFLAGNEPPQAVPESREFYWSKIERAIRQAEAAPRPRAKVSWWLAWRRILAPASALAAVAGVVFLTLQWVGPSEPGDGSGHLTVVEDLSEYTESFAFRSQSENMFVVWIHNKELGFASEADDGLLDDVMYQ